MPEAPFTPPPRKPVSEHPVPDHSVAFYTELVNRDDPAYYANAPVKRGAMYSTMVGAKQAVIDQYPELFFLKERKFQLNDQLVLWDWATDENAHDTYNAEITYVGNAINYPAFTRVYTTRRELYEQEPTLPIGSNLPGIIAVTITSPGQNYTKGYGEIDGTSVAIQFNVSPNGGLISGIITNTGEELIQNGTPITIIGDGQDGEAVAVTQPVGCVLTQQKKEELPDQDPTGHELVKVTRVYETLPGPWIYTTRFDKDGDIVTTKTRRQVTAYITDRDVVENGEWIQTFHKGTDDFASEETVESRPCPGNDIVSTKVEQDGKILTSVKQLVETSTVVSSETLIGTNWVKKYGDEVDDGSIIKVHQASNKVSWQMTETRDIPGNPIPATDLDKDGNEIDVVRTMKASTAIVTDETIVGGIWIRTDSEQIGDLVSWEIVRARVIPGDPIPSSNVGADHEVADIATTLKESTTITPSATELAGVITTVEGREVTELVSEEVVTDKPFLDEALYSIAIPNVIPELFRAFIPVRVESHILAGVASPPVLGPGEFERSERQVTKLLFERRATVLDSVSIPITFCGFKDTNQYKQVVTTCYTLEADSVIPATPTALCDVEVIQLGNGMQVEITKCVPNVFRALTYEEKKPDVTPEVFKALIPLDTVSEIVTGSPVQPVLGSGQYDASEREVTELTKETSLTSRNLTILPETVTSFETNRDKQVVTVNQTLEVDPTVPPVPDATTDISYRPLGDGTAIEETRSIPEVFDGQVYEKEIPDVVPIEFRVAIPTETQEVSQAGTATDPTMGAGDLTKRETQTDTFVKRVLHRFRSLVGLPITLISYATSSVKQLVTVTRTLKIGGAPTPPSATTTVETQNLGDGTVIETVNSVPDVFDRAQYGIRIPDVVPVEFRVAVPTTTTSLDATGTAAAPTLGAGDLSKTEQQVDEFVKRSETEHRQALSYPISLPASKLTPEGQVETITQVLDVGLQIATGNALTVESEVKNLGDGTSLKTEGTVPTVFAQGVYRVEIPDLVPQEFRPFVPTTSSAVTSAGTASTTPVLGLGDLSKQEAQTTEFKKRVTTESRGSIVLPITHLNKEVSTRFGGGVINKSITLETTGSGTVDTGLIVLESSITDLGNGQEIKRTDQLDGVAWPVLASRLWDENMRLEYDETNQVVVAGTAEDPDPGGVFAWSSEVRSIDEWRSRKTNVSKPTPAYIDSASALISYSFEPYTFPGLFQQYTGTFAYYQSARSSLVQHIIRTWWEKSVTAPVVTFDELIPGGVTFLGAQYNNVFHDFVIDPTTGINYFPTTPSFTQYRGTVTVNTLPGTTNFTNGSTTVTGGGFLALVNPGDIVAGYTVASVTNDNAFEYNNPYPGPTASYTGVIVYHFSGGFINTERVIIASVTPEREKDIWKVVTKSVIMR